MRTIRPLLALGNSHLGEAIHSWSLPAVSTCPGATAACMEDCYARKGFFCMPSVKRRMAWNLAQSRLPQFADRMTAEVRKKGALVVRVHVAGDFYSADYARKWEAVAARCPATTFYWYSRSWRVPEIEAELARMSELANVLGWYSTDRDTGPPARVPGRVRVAFLQTEAGEGAGEADLAFRVQRLRRAGRVGLPAVCPKNVGSVVSTNCGVCQKCWT